MSYISFQTMGISYQPDDISMNEEFLNEDIKTFLHNYWTRSIGGFHGVNEKQWGWILNLVALNIPGAIVRYLTNYYGFTDYIDQSYFNSMYEIKPSLQKKLLGFCSKIKNACKITDKENNKDRNDLGSGNSERLARANTRKATRDFGDGMTTTATAFYKLYINNDTYYLLYFTFDGHKIFDVKVLCSHQKEFSSNNDDYYVEKLYEFDDIGIDEYKK